eukprot:1794815-Rhodomonas_salina.5
MSAPNIEFGQRRQRLDTSLLCSRSEAVPDQVPQVDSVKLHHATMRHKMRKCVSVPGRRYSKTKKPQRAHHTAGRCGGKALDLRF